MKFTEDEARACRHLLDLALTEDLGKVGEQARHDHDSSTEISNHYSREAPEDEGLEGKSHHP